MAAAVPLILSAAGPTAAAVGAPTAAVMAISSLASAGLSIYGGYQQASTLRQQAALQDFDARQELLTGQQQSNRIRETLLRALATQNATYGAAGIDVGSGSPITVAQDTMEQADRELDISRYGALVRAAPYRAAAADRRARASQAILSGYQGGARSLLDVVPKLRSL